MKRRLAHHSPDSPRTCGPRSSWRMTVADVDRVGSTQPKGAISHLASFLRRDAGVCSNKSGGSEWPGACSCPVASRCSLFLSSFSQRIDQYHETVTP